MNMAMILIDSLPVYNFVTFHFIQPISFSPIAPDQYFSRIRQITLKKIRADVQKVVPISFRVVPGFSIESSRFAR